MFFVVWEAVCLSEYEPEAMGPCPSFGEGGNANVEDGEGAMLGARDGTGDNEMSLTCGRVGGCGVRWGSSLPSRS